MKKRPLPRLGGRSRGERLGGKTRKSDADAIEAAAMTAAAEKKGEKEWKILVVVVVEEKERRWEEQEGMEGLPELVQRGNARRDAFDRRRRGLSGRTLALQ